jgi:site-specific recombinase XerD
MPKLPGKAFSRYALREKSNHGRYATPELRYQADRSKHVLGLRFATMDWARLREIVDIHLRIRGYRAGSRLVYKQVLLDLERKLPCQPGQLTTEILRRHLGSLARGGATPYWMASTISVIRSVFDRLGNRGIALGIRTPRRPQRLPEILSRRDVKGIFQALPTYRDRLMVGLMYGCGLRVQEIRALRWKHVDVSQRTIAVPGPRSRSIKLPKLLEPLLAQGATVCPPAEHVLPGNTAGRPLSGRMMALIVRRAAEVAGIEIPVTCLMLRHAYAAHALEQGVNIRQLQADLGHRQIETTMRYERPLRLEAGAASCELEISPAPLQSLSADEYAMSQRLRCDGALRLTRARRATSASKV